MAVSEFAYTGNGRVENFCSNHQKVFILWLKAVEHITAYTVKHTGKCGSQNGACVTRYDTTVHKS